jgi:ubiquinone biosynthesis protein
MVRSLRVLYAGRDVRSLALVRLLAHLFSSRPVDLAWIESQGVLAVKIAQTFALRLDFLPAERCQQLARLYTETKQTIPAESFEALVAAATPPGWRDAFVHLEREPFAAASVGQVHAGRLHDGRDVVVKLLKGQFVESFRRDVTAAERLVRLALLAYPTLRRVADPQGIVEGIREATLAELDLRNEVLHRDELAQIASDWSDRFDLHRLAFANVVRDLSGEQVLVSERIVGPTINELLTRGELSYDILLDLFRIQGFYLFCVGTFHGDLHPGNIIRRGDELVFLDTGAIGRTSERMRRGLFTFMLCLSRGDFDGCADALRAMSLVPLTDGAFVIFRDKLLALYRDFPGRTVQEVSLTRQMMDTVKLAVRSGMDFERGMYPVIKSLMYLDGMVLRCNPQAVLMRDIRDFAERAASIVLP